MNSNEIITLLRDKGYEKGTRECLLRLAEELHDQNRTIGEMAKAFEALVTVQTMLNNVADNMKDKLDKLARQDDDPSSTRGQLS